MHVPTQPKPLSRGFLGLFRWAFVPLGLLSLVAVGVHVAADALDDALLPSLQSLDVWFDSLFASHTSTATWVHVVESREQTLIARGLSLGLEVLTDIFYALPLLSFSTSDSSNVLLRSTPQPKMKLARPALILLPLFTFLFVCAGALAISRLVESTVYFGLSGDLASPETAAISARGISVFSVLLAITSLGIHALSDTFKRAQQRSLIHSFGGIRRSLLAVPLVLVMAVEALTYLSMILK